MPYHKSAKKSLLQNHKRKLVNHAMKHRALTFYKKTVSSLKSGAISDAEKTLRLAQSAFGKAVKKGVFHTNKAARHISKLYKKMTSLAN